MSETPAPQEAEAGGPVVQGQPEQHGEASLKKKKNQVTKSIVKLARQHSIAYFNLVVQRATK